LTQNETLLKPLTSESVKRHYSCDGSWFSCRHCNCNLPYCSSDLHNCLCWGMQE